MSMHSEKKFDQCSSNSTLKNKVFRKIFGLLGNVFASHVL